MGLDGVLGVEAGADGVTERQTTLPVDADSVERAAQSLIEIAPIQTQSLREHLDLIWRQYNQSHFRDNLAGIHRSPELWERDFLRRAKHQSRSR